MLPGCESKTVEMEHPAASKRMCLGAAEGMLNECGTIDIERYFEIASVLRIATYLNISNQSARAELSGGLTHNLQLVDLLAVCWGLTAAHW